MEVAFQKPNNTDYYRNSTKTELLKCLISAGFSPKITNFAKEKQKCACWRGHEKINHS